MKYAFAGFGWAKFRKVVFIPGLSSTGEDPLAQVSSWCHEIRHLRGFVLLNKQLSSRRKGGRIEEGRRFLSHSLQRDNDAR